MHSPPAPSPDMIHAFLTCALWSSTVELHPDTVARTGYAGNVSGDSTCIDDDGDSLFDADDADADAVTFAGAFLAGCLAIAPDGILDTWDEGQFGHDAWLTYNGHGAGFWDRTAREGFDPVAGRAMADALGSAYLYVYDNGDGTFGIDLCGSPMPGTDEHAAWVARFA